MKTRTEMVHYLGLNVDNYEEQGFSSVVDTAMKLQKTYDLDKEYGLGLVGDFESMPHILEDLEDSGKLIEVKRENGVVVYIKGNEVMELTTIEQLIKKLSELPQNAKVFVGGTTGYLHIVEDENGNTAISFDDSRFI